MRRRKAAAQPHSLSAALSLLLFLLSDCSAEPSTPSFPSSPSSSSSSSSAPPGSFAFPTEAPPGLVCDAALPFFAFDGRKGDNFGASVAAFGGLFAAGSPLRSAAPTTVSLYRVSLAQQSAALARVLTAPDLSQGDGFGGSLALAEALLVVGAPLYSQRKAFEGIVYVYAVRPGDGEGEGGEGGAGAEVAFVAPLSPEKSEENAVFGYAVAMRDTLIAVGAPGDRVKGRTGAGSASLFAYDDGAEEVRLLVRLEAPDARASDGFGYAVALGDSLLAVGAPGRGSSAGAVYVFGVGGDGRAALLARLESAAPRANNFFGASLAVSAADAEDAAAVVVGEPGADSSDGKLANVGAVQVFAVRAGREGGEHVQTLALTDGPHRLGEPQFGYAMSVAGDRLVVGSPGAFAGTGTAYVFNALQEDDAAAKGYGYTEELRIGGYAPRAGDNVGYSVALDPEESGVLVVGSPGFDFAGQDTGLVVATLCAGDGAEEPETTPVFSTAEPEGTTDEPGPTPCPPGAVTGHDCRCSSSLRFSFIAAHRPVV